MKVKKFRYFMGDFETTVYDGQDYTEVWASACVELGTEDVKIFHSIKEQYDYLLSLKTNVVIYYHNLKFDGAFWLSYLMCDLKYSQAYKDLTGEGIHIEFQYDRDMKNKSFKYSISDMGQFYTITIKANDHIIEIRDSYKLLPFTVKRIGESFKTKHKKLEMEYKGLRYAGCPITEKEKEYIANDVLVVKEALEIMFEEGHNSLTIGACCLSEFKKTYDKQEYNTFFPNIYEIPIDKDIHAVQNAGAWIRKSYRGGWCYVAKGKEGKVFSKETTGTTGVTADVNSLYPSVMSSESGCRYPIGTPTFWQGNYIPKEAQAENRYFFIRVRTRFYLKKNKLPFIQLKCNLHYRGNDMLETSDVYDPATNRYYKEYYDMAGNICQCKPEITMTQTDWYLFNDHYNLVDCEIIDGCYFWSEIGIFDTYINKYKKIKQESTGALRELAKLFLNNLYGKMAMSTNSSFKFAYVKENGSVGFKTIFANEKKPGYIPIGSAITSYARDFTIRHAQMNYHGVNKPGFIYADTDSIHCDLPADKLIGIEVHPYNFCCWKLEACWDKAIFTRQKTYIEHVTHENMKEIKPIWNVKCAGMPDKSKDLFIISISDKEELTDKQKEVISKATEEDKKFLKKKRTLKDFKVGLKVPGKLLPKRIKGGILLTDTTYEMRG